MAESQEWRMHPPVKRKMKMYNRELRIPCGMYLFSGWLECAINDVCVYIGKMIIYTMHM